MKKSQLQLENFCKDYKLVDMRMRIISGATSLRGKVLDIGCAELAKRIIHGRCTIQIECRLSNIRRIL